MTQLRGRPRVLKGMTPAVRHRRLGVGALLAGTVLCVFASTAGATLPGRNGLLAFSSRPTACDLTTDVFTVRSDGTRLRRVVSYPCPSNTSALRPAWSPSGARLLHVKSVASYPGPPPEAVVMRPNGSGAHVVAQGFALGWGPAARLAWTFGGEIYVGPFENPRERHIAAGAQAAWSPDGAELAVTGSPPNREGCSALSIYDALTAARKRVLVQPRAQADGCVNGAISPDWSPDGRWVAFSGTGSRSVTKDNYDIYVIRRNGTGLRRLTRGDGAHSTPVWSPDGRSIAYVAPSRPPPARYQSDLYVMRRNGSHKRRIARRATSPSWQPRP